MNDIRIQQNGTVDIIAASDGRLTLSIPIQLKRRSGCKKIMLPNEDSGKAKHWNSKATPLQLALARSHHWLRILESGEVQSLKEVAEREGVDNSYVSRMVNLTCLSPEIVAAILEDEMPDHITLFELAVDPSVLWEEQRGRVIEASNKIRTCEITS